MSVDFDKLIQEAEVQVVKAHELVAALEIDLERAKRHKKAAERHMMNVLALRDQYLKQGLGT